MKNQLKLISVGVALFIVSLSFTKAVKMIKNESGSYSFKEEMVAEADVKKALAK